MTSKARFTSGGKHAASKNQSGAGGSGSKKGNQPIAGATGKGGHIQVIHNGKIVTPQSLLPRKTARANYSSKKISADKISNSHDPEDEDDIQPGDEGPDGEKDSTHTLKKPNIAASSMRKGTAAAEGDGSMSRVRSSAMTAALAQKLEDEVVVVHLSESETEILLALPSLVLSTDVREAKEVEESNRAYEGIIEAHKNSDGFAARLTQTVNYPQKSQNDMAAPNASQDSGCQSTGFDIADAMAGSQSIQADEYSLLTPAEAAEGEHETGLSTHVAKFVADTVRVSLSTPGCLLDSLDVSTGPPPGAQRGQRGATKNQSDSGAGKSRSMANVSGINVGSVGHVVIDGAADHSSSGVQVSGSHNLSGGQGEEQDAFDIDDVSDVRYDGQKALEEASREAVLSSNTIVKKLQMVERAVQQNAYHEHILEYRDFPEVQPLQLVTENEKAAVVDSVDQLFGGGLASTIVRSATPSGVNASQADSEGGSTNKKQSHLTGGAGHDHSVSVGNSSADDGGMGASGHFAGGSSYTQDIASRARVMKLFRFSAPSLVRGRPVTCMSWNSENTDLLAVGYGKINFVSGCVQTKDANGKELTEEELASGLVLFWSIRNPDYPEKVLHTPHAITAIDFSKRNPTLLAVGFYNGDIAVYDVRSEVDWDKPMETSAGMTGSHSDPVWQVKWLAKGQDRLETLISISTDGNVLQWSLKKGLLVSLLMQLKRGGAGEGWISRQASGLCFDFAPDDPSTYVTGTEEGSLHRCSVSYSEQYLDTYDSHGGPVYRLRFSPWWGDIFLSCSADWTMSLYHMRSTWPLLTFHSSGEDFSVNDIAWCPGNSTVFAAVTADAKLQLWDISVSDIDPVISLDTNLDVADLLASEAATEAASAAGATMGVMRKGAATASTAPGTRRDYGSHRDAQREDSEKDTPVTRLLKNLANGNGNAARRTLTTVTFSANSPVAVVGDSTGVVTVYRVNDPQTITEEGNPAGQILKLKEAVWRQADPSDVAKLQHSTASTATEANGSGDKAQPPAKQSAAAQDIPNDASQ